MSRFAWVLGTATGLLLFGPTQARADGCSTGPGADEEGAAAAADCKTDTSLPRSATIILLGTGLAGVIGVARRQDEDPQDDVV
jgi:hypothetical protein